MGAIPENSQRMYKGLVRMLTDVRMEGNHDYIEPDTFADESRDSPHVKTIDTSDRRIPRQIRKIKDILAGDVEFDLHRWYDQAIYVEVWLEKQAMYSTFESILDDYEVGIQSSKGFNSLSILYEA